MVNDARSTQLLQAAQIAPAITKLIELADDLLVAFCVPWPSCVSRSKDQIAYHVPGTAASAEMKHKHRCR